MSEKKSEKLIDPWEITRTLARGAGRYGASTAGACVDLAWGIHNAVKGIRGPRFNDPAHSRDLKEAGAVTGLVLLNEVPWNPASEEAREAYALAYPGLSSKESLEEAIHRLQDHPESLEGLLSGIKGKMMEMRSADLLGDSLPEGSEVKLAGSTTQPGYDLEFHAPDGSIFGVAQVKATESPAAILDHYQLHPQIPVITTQENAAALGNHPALAAQQPDISHADLEQEMAALQDATGAIDALPLGAGAVVIWHLATGEGTTSDRLVDAAGALGRNTPAILAAGAVGGLTGGALIPILITTFGTRWITGEGEKSRLKAWADFKKRWGWNESVIVVS